MVDAQDQSEPDGPFSWKQELVAKAERWITGETFSLLVGSHRGYMRLSEPVEHRRFVVAGNVGAFFIRDLVEGTGRHRVELSWRLSPELQLQPGDVFRLRQSSQGLALVTVEKHGWSEEIHKGPWSPAYGVQRTTTVLRFGVSAELPIEFATLLVPLAEANERPGKLFRAFPETKEVSAYNYKTTHDEQHFYFRNSGQTWICGRVSSDADFVCLRILNDQPTQIVFCSGTYVAWDEKRLIAASRQVERCEVLVGETVQVFCSDPQSIMITPGIAAKIMG
jgi:hypothetical protein